MSTRRAEPDKVPHVSGSQHPAAWGHRFGPLLSCDRCGVRWSDHAREPKPCAEAPPPRERAAEPEPRDLADPKDAGPDRIP